VTEFEIGNLDVITVPASEYFRTELPGVEGVSFIIPGLNTYYLGFNCSRPLLIM